MAQTSGGVAVITGYGPGLGGALARRLAASGRQVVGLSRSGRAAPEAGEGVRSLSCDVTDAAAARGCFETIAAEMGPCEILVHNAAHLLIQPFEETAPDDFERLWRTAVLGLVHCGQIVLPQMAERSGGVVLVSGATASVKGGAKFSAFAASKFALRGLAQSLARHYGPRGVHVIHTLIDGVIWGERADKAFGMDPSACMDPDAIARTYMSLIEQPKSAWTHEADLRPFSESF